MAAALAHAAPQPSAREGQPLGYDALISEPHVEANQGRLKKLRSLKFEKPKAARGK
jgi:hypothetical protein